MFELVEFRVELEDGKSTLIHSENNLIHRFVVLLLEEFELVDVHELVVHVEAFAKVLQVYLCGIHKIR